MARSCWLGWKRHVGSIDYQCHAFVVQLARCGYPFEFDGFGGEPDSIDANHWARPRMKHAQPPGSEAGHFTVMDLSPKGSEMITISSAARLGAGFTGTKVGSVAGD